MLIIEELMILLQNEYIRFQDRATNEDGIAARAMTRRNTSPHPLRPRKLRTAPCMLSRADQHYTPMIN